MMAMCFSLLTKVAIANGPMSTIFHTLDVTSKILLLELEQLQSETIPPLLNTTCLQEDRPVYYQTPGGCKYGSNCRYMHESGRSEAGPELNFLGLPMRLGEKECPFYMRTGSCKYGSNCRFHHPNPTGVGEPGLVSGYHDNGSSHQHVSGVSLPNTTWRSQGSSNQSVSVDTLGSCVPGILLPHQLHQTPEWNGYQAPPNSLYSLEGNKKYPSVQTTYSLPTNVNGHSGQFPVQNEEYPQRPGQPECQFYMENGSCRYKSSCRFHHPKDRLARPAMCLLSPMGLPIRPVSSNTFFFFPPNLVIDLHKSSDGPNRHCCRWEIVKRLLSHAHRLGSLAKRFWEDGWVGVGEHA
ncbi:hypothetical protein Taro_050543, partial [Colocasia esculenta]|nr:hypothetical protein [Colocasia esculenta]